MARYDCRCGKALSNSLTPDIQLMVYTDSEWDKILETDTIETWMIPFPKRCVWRCPNCERIYVFEKNNLIKCYALEK